MIHQWQGKPVPSTVMWSAENRYFVDICPVVGKLAICQNEAQDQGSPKFGHPHAIRQRRMLMEERCDLCEEYLKNTGKYCLSAIDGIDCHPYSMLSVVEPLLHKQCAIVSITECPELQRQITAGVIRVRQVFLYRPRLTQALSQECIDFIPDYDGSPIIGQAMLDILKWRDVTAEFIK